MSSNPTGLCQETLYEKKATARNPVMRNTTKLLLNSLLGRFGLNIFKDRATPD